MKKVISVVLCFMMTVMLSCCTSGEISQLHTEATEIQTYATESTENSVTFDALADDVLYSYTVTAARDENFSYVDGVGNSYDIDMRYPCINMESSGADSVNAEIAEKYDKIIGSVEDCVSDSTSTHIYDLNYEYYESNEILSLFITTHYEGGSKYYGVYNLDLRGGERIGNQEIIAKLSLDESTVLANLKTQTEKTYRELYSGDSVLDESVKAYYEDQLVKCISDENLSNAEYFIKDGKLCAVVKVYGLAGAGESSTVVEIMDI